MEGPPFYLTQLANEPHLGRRYFLGPHVILDKFLARNQSTYRNKRDGNGFATFRVKAELPKRQTMSIDRTFPITRPAGMGGLVDDQKPYR